jgi:hypothetical protein
MKMKNKSEGKRLEVVKIFFGDASEASEQKRCKLPEARNVYPKFFRSPGIARLAIKACFDCSLRSRPYKTTYKPTSFSKSIGFLSLVISGN